MNRTNRSHIYSAFSNWHDYGVLSQTREIFLESGDEGIGSKHAVEFIKNLVMLESLSDNPIIVHQYNIGGDQNAGFAIYDAIKASKCKFLFICYGSASSMRNGLVIDRPLFGFRLYSTNAIAVSSGAAASKTFGSSGSNEYALLYGHQSGVATANHIAKTELIRDPDSFSDIVRGLHVFGRKVLRTDAVYSGVITIG